MYRIVWLTSQNPLGESRSREEERLENVILWIIANHSTLVKRSGNYSVYLDRDDGSIPETLWNWQHDKNKCFGRLYVKGFRYMLHLIDGELRVYTDAAALATDGPITVTPDEFARLFTGDCN